MLLLDEADFLSGGQLVGSGSVDKDIIASFFSMVIYRYPGVVVLMSSLDYTVPKVLQHFVAMTANLDEEASPATSSAEVRG